MKKKRLTEQQIMGLLKGSRGGSVTNRDQRI